ncbi:MAG: alpha/beta fold hydrolase [Thermoplasmata archaeon]
MRSFDGARIAYRSFGRGPGIVIVHGGVSSSNDLLSLGRALSGRLPVLVMDRRGRGGSDPPGADYCLAREYRDAAAVLSATASFALFGHSYDALVALGTARELPLRRLIVYDPPILVAATAQRLLPEYRAALAAGDYVEAYRRIVVGLDVLHGISDRVFADHLRANVVPTPGWQELRRLLDAGARELEEGAKVPTEPSAYRSIPADTLLIVGAESAEFIRRSVEMLGAALRSSRVVTLPHQGHTAVLEIPAEIARIIAEFLGTAGAGT